ncbi:AraC family transcriptional regulator [Chitinophaga sp. 22321]|uniref:AraC family transcriptional regulator n=1 Tax=Chitinophaga hostae TaxID=2831022 RepID=A0ABS5IZE7_9BACT|nr:AraC family transcriptional regulator [Chitinophaga hostae]MBS0027692.1 AraC family transcriptional regulator [Chitinophaga hostae]
MQQDRQTDISYEGGQVVAFPKKILSKCSRLPLIQRLYINRMGIFPHAVNHYYKREAGQVSYAVLLYCFDGEGWIILGKKKFILKAGDAYIIPPFSAHSYGAADKSPWSIFWVHIAGSGAGEIADAVKITQKDAPIHTVYSEERNNLFNQMLKTLSNGFSVANLLYANLILPNYLGSFICPASFNSFSTTSPIEENILNEAVLFMKKNVEQKITVEVVAKHIGMSPSFFFKQFKKHTGYSPVAYFNFLKIQKAIQLIHTTQYNISEVGSKIGIDDPYYFSRLFKKQMGISPRQYINEFILPSRTYQ